MSITSLGIASSGMKAAQMGLSVTGHNMANSSVAGYSRQRVLQSASSYLTIGYDGSRKIQTGLGTEIDAINQIRCKYLDMQYRTEAGKLGYHNKKFETGLEIENIVGELESSYKAQSVMQDMWDSINELVLDPTGIETRGTFISTAITFVNKIDNISERLFDEQNKLNTEIIKTVDTINHYVEQVKQLNEKIAKAEVSGDNANDYRDERALYVDELSHMLNLTTKTDPRTGMVELFSEGAELLKGQSVNTLGLRYTAPGSSFVEPVFTTSKETLPYEPYSNEYQNTRALFNFTGSISKESGNDSGALKGMLVARGTEPANYTSLRSEPSITQLNENTPQEIAFATSLKNILIQRPVDISGLIGTISSTSTDAQIATVVGQIELLSSVTGLSVALPSPAVLSTDTDPKKFNDYLASVQSAIKKANGVASSLQNDLIDESWANGNADMLKQIQKYNRITEHEYKKDVFNSTQAIIPTFQRQFDTLVNAVVDLVNNTFSPTEDEDSNPNTPDKLASDAPYGADGSQGVEIFVRKEFDRYDSNGYLIEEDSRDLNTLYSMGNIEVNSLFSDPANYGMIATSKSGDASDTTVLLEIAEKWKSGIASFEGSEPISVENYYRTMILHLGMQTNESRNYTETQIEQVQQADAKRSELSGVAMDEEMSNMLKYQHAYNASARIFSVIDSMLDKIINQM